MDLKKTLYNLFDPEPCKEEFYVPLDEVRGSSGLVEQLADGIRLSDKPVYKLLAGHRGSGKSTELIRLQKKLEEGKDKYFVVLFDAVKERNLDPLDVDFPEVLIAITTHLSNQIKERLNINLTSPYLSRLFKDLKDISTAFVDFSQISLNTGLLKLSGTLTKNPNIRQKLREKITPISDQWIAATNSIIDTAIDEISKKKYAGLVIIVDGLDKILMNTDPEKKSCAERLFDDWNVQLRSLNCHMLYTIPIALAYSGSERNIASNFGLTSPPVIPMTKLFDNEDKETKGFDKFLEIIQKRINSTGADINEVFENGKETVRKAIRYSGGQPRELMVLIREAILGGDLPIKDASIDKAAGNISNSYRRQLWQEHWEVIEFVRQHHRLKRDNQNDRICMDLLDMRAVLQYKNDKEWYNLNPLLPGKQGD